MGSKHLGADLYILGLMLKLQLWVPKMQSLYCIKKK